MMWLLAALSFSADVTGFWTGQTSNRLGTQDIILKLDQQGSAITGKLYGDRGSSPISEGRSMGDTVIFVVTIQEQNGNQINDTRMRYTGSLKNGELELVRDRESSTIAGNSGGVFQRATAKQIVRFKRLY